MYLGGLIDDLGFRVKDFDVSEQTGTANRGIAARYINRAYKWIYSSHHWEWRFKTGQTTLIPNYTTGTCTVTGFDGTNDAAARTVTFSVSLPSNIQGRYFKPNGENSWHKIQYISGLTVYLETPILRSSAGGLTFNIWKRIYYLSGEVAAIMDFGRWDNRFGRLEYKSFSNLVDRVVDVSDDGTPDTFSPFGVDNYEPVYSTGTIQIDKDTNLAIGTGTAWLGNVLPGDEVTEGDKVYTVKRVETDTRIILVNYAPNATPAATEYKIKRNLSVGFQFYPNKIDTYMTIPFYYQDRVFDMVHEDKDRTNLPDDFDDAILTRAEFKLKKDKSYSDWPLVAQLFSSELDGLKRDFRVAKPRGDIFAPETRGYPGR